MIHRRIARGLLGSHVRGSAQREPDIRNIAGVRHLLHDGLRDVRRDLPRMHQCELPSARDHLHRAQRLRNPEVGDQRTAIRKKYVLRLDVTMDYSTGMRVRERTCHVPDETLGVVQRECTLAIESRPKCLTAYEWHYEVDRIAGIAHFALVQQRDDVRMTQRRNKSHLASEPIGVATCRDRGRENFHCDTVSRTHVERDEDATHSASADFGFEHVPRTQDVASALAKRVGTGRLQGSIGPSAPTATPAGTAAEPAIRSQSYTRAAAIMPTMGASQ